MLSITRINMRRPPTISLFNDARILGKLRKVFRFAER